MIKTRTSGIQVARESASPVYFPLHFPRPLPMISSQSVQPCTSGTNLFGRNIWPSAAIFSFLIPWRFSRAGRARADISQHGKRQLRSERIGGGGLHLQEQGAKVHPFQVAFFFSISSPTCNPCRYQCRRMCVHRHKHLSLR